MRRWVAALFAFAVPVTTGGCQSRPLDVGDAGGGAGGTGARDAAPFDVHFDRSGSNRLSAGQPCSFTFECLSGFCVDGVCCNSACGACTRCDLNGTIGTCVSVPAGEVPRTLSECVAEPRSTCGLDGTCDGAGRCRSWPHATVCAPGSCDGDSLVGQMICDGAGQCRPGAPQICAPYTCDPISAACRDGCATDGDCQGSYCETTGFCHVNLAPCTNGGQCASGFCSGRVCCDVACDDPGMSCNLPRREGTCSPVSAS